MSLIDAYSRTFSRVMFPNQTFTQTVFEETDSSISEGVEDRSTMRLILPTSDDRVIFELIDKQINVNEVLERCSSINYPTLESEPIVFSERVSSFQEEMEEETELKVSLPRTNDDAMILESLYHRSDEMRNEDE